MRRYWSINSSKMVEIDVDALCDGNEVIIGGMLEHVEEAGIHSGDSACVIPSFSCPSALPTACVKSPSPSAKPLMCAA